MSKIKKGKEMTKNEIKKKENEEVMSFTEVDEKLMDKMSTDSEQYVDDVRPEDIAIPRINILQTGSPQVIKANVAEYIEGAEAGDFYSTLTQEVFKGEQGIYFVVAARTISYPEWKDRQSGGGLVRVYPDSSAYNKCKVINGKHITAEGNEIVETHEVIGTLVNIENKTYSMAMFSLSHSKVKKMKIWNSLMRCLVDKKTGKQLPCYAGIYKITTVPQSNDKGSWYNINIKASGYTLAIPEVGEKIYESSKDFAKLFSEKKINIKPEQEQGDLFEDGKI